VDHVVVVDVRHGLADLAVEVDDFAGVGEGSGLGADVPEEVPVGCVLKDEEDSVLTLIRGRSGSRKGG